MKKNILAGIGLFGSGVVWLAGEWIGNRLLQALEPVMPSIPDPVLILVLHYAPAVLLLALGICAFLGWGASVHVSLVRPFLRRASPSDAEKIHQQGSATELGNPTRRLELVASLRSLANAASSIKIQFATNDQQPTAEALRDIFALAGWQASDVGLALEPYIRARIDGIEVRGVSQHLVDGVTQALAKAGFGGIRQTISGPEIPPNNPKYQIALNRVWVIVGRGDAAGG